MSDAWKDQPRVPAGNEAGGQWTSGGFTKQSAQFRPGMKPVGRAMGTHINIQPSYWQTLDEGAKKDIMAHELAHNVVEDLIYKTPGEWERATDVLLLETKETPSLHFEFMLGQSKFGEAIVEAITAYVRGHQDPMLSWEDDRPPPWSAERWAAMLDWAEHALTLAGVDKETFNREVERLIRELDYD